MARLKAGWIQVEVDSDYFGGQYTAQLWRVQSLMTDHTRARLARRVMDLWPCLVQTVAARKWVRAQPAFLLAIFLVQEDGAFEGSRGDRCAHCGSMDGTAKVREGLVGDDPTCDACARTIQAQSEIECACSRSGNVGDCVCHESDRPGCYGDPHCSCPACVEKLHAEDVSPADFEEGRVDPVMRAAVERTHAALYPHGCPNDCEACIARLGRRRCYLTFGHLGPHRWQRSRLPGDPVGSCPAREGIES
jgi:hypothetical protein